MSVQRINFGGLETKLLFQLEMAETKFVTTAQIMETIGISRTRANKLAWQLAKKKRLLRITKGLYLFAPFKAGPKGHWSEDQFVIVSKIMGKRMHYIGFWSALNYYHLTEQIPLITQVVVTQKMRKTSFSNIKLEFIKLKRLGEWHEERIGNEIIKIASIEQLMIDCLTYPAYCGGMIEVSKALWEARNTIDWKKLKKLVSKSKNVVKRRLGYLLELHNIHKLKIKDSFSGWRWLDSSRQKIVKEKSLKWGLLLNSTTKELKDWMNS